MRILHTSDWHLGKRLHQLSREDEHAAFLAWLLRALQDHNVEVLVVAGDIFDTDPPSSQAQAQLFGFLGQLATVPSLRHTVLVGGNHDSAARLDAPSPVLHPQRVSVVGGYLGGDNDPDRYLVPVVGADGGVGVVVAAVPYLDHYRLGVRFDGDESAFVAARDERFRAFHQSLADRAQERWPGVPTVITGHLTLGVPESDQDTEGSGIHHVGGLGGFRPTIFGASWSHVALGHIHRPYRVTDTRAWYSGSPFPLRETEVGYAHKVLLVDMPDIAGEPARVQPVEVPLPRALHTVRGTLEDVAAALQPIAEAARTAPRAAWVVAEVVAPEPIANLQYLLDELVTRHNARDRVVVISSRQVRTAEQQAAADAAASMTRPELHTITPRELFVGFWEARIGEAPSPRHIAAFEEVVAATPRT